jgi:hypothetical protein
MLTFKRFCHSDGKPTNKKLCELISPIHNSQPPKLRIQVLFKMHESWAYCQGRGR